MAGAEWRRSRLFREPRLRRAAPVVVPVLLLSYMGVGEAGDGGPFDPDLFDPDLSRIDVLAHLAGLVWGIPLGYAAATWEPQSLHVTRNQAVLGVLALALVAVAWVVALSG